MKYVPTFLLYSRDRLLIDRLVRISAEVAVIHAVETRDALCERFTHSGSTVLLADVRTANCLDVLSEVKRDWPDSILIVMGMPRSDPMLAAVFLDPYAMIGLEPDRRDYQMLLRHAAESLTLRQKVRVLEDELTVLSTRQNIRHPEPRLHPATPLQNFSRAQRNFDNLEKLFDSVVDGLVETARVSRAGIFIKTETSDAYAYQAGMRCPEITRQQTFSTAHPFVRWLEAHMHLVSRQTLDTVSDPEERALLKKALDSLGAEIILPLHDAAGPLQGWLFAGRPATGIPFEITDLEELSRLADHISTTLEKALQYKDTALQKALAETVLHSIPFGIVACDENGVVRWFNSTAHEILQPAAEQIIGKKVETLGSQIADLMRTTLLNQQEGAAREWTDSRIRRTLSAESRCLMDEGLCVGVMMMLHDVTGAKLLKEKEEQLERTAFWTDLAASMSHEIRNPLVAIKTFSQLLPERYDDTDFRAEFGAQVSEEVDKLNHIIDKINRFADHPQLVFKPLDIRRPIENAVTRLQSEFDHDNLKIHLSAVDSPLKVNGDIASLEECFYHILRNAAENLNNCKDACIRVSVKDHSPNNGPGTLFVIIADNGSGIDASVRDKLFSPFSTIKARGLGLGLPIAKRSIIDHNGRMDLESSRSGTVVTIRLPALEVD